MSGTNPNTGQAETAQQFIVDELAARLAKAQSAGADAIEFDNVDVYQNKTGLTISAATQEQFDAATGGAARRSQGHSWRTLILVLEATLNGP